MRKIYTLLLALVATMTAFAQNPDPSKWEKEQNVVADLGMGDVDPQQAWTMKSNGGTAGVAGDFGNYWQGVGQKFFFDYNQFDGDSRESATCVGFYSDGKIDEEPENLYQIVKIPAGHYTVRFQGCYRDRSGQQVGNMASDYVNGKFAYHAYAYVETYETQADAKQGEDPLRTFKTRVRSIVSEKNAENLTSSYSGGDEWRNDGSSVFIEKEINARGKEVEVEKTYYFPRSIIGIGQYYLKGFYWNEFDILLDKDAYVRIGIYEDEKIAESWTTFSEWQIIYHGEPTDDVQMEFAEQEFETEYSKLNSFKEQFNNASFDGFDASFNQAIGSYIEDAAMTAEFNFNDTYELKTRLDILDELKEMNYIYEDLFKDLGNLSYVLVKSNKLLETTDYPGKAAFQSAYDAILAKINGCTTADFEGITPSIFEEQNFNALVDARGDYLETQAPDEETGARDFSKVINHPWFVNDEYEPTKKEDGSWSIDEETWQNAVGGGDANYTDRLTYTQDEVEYTRTAIASEVELLLNDTKATNQWFQYINMDGKSNGLSIYYDDRGLIGAADTWHGGAFKSGSMEVRQKIVGLPSGYYSLKALIRGWDSGQSSPNNYMNAFMENSEGERMESQHISPDDEGWQEVTTGIIHVSDRQLLIGGQADNYAHYTGFRLFYYGENPPVDKLIRQQIAEVKALAEETELYEGDRKYVSDLIDKCVEPYEGTAIYEEYKGYLDQANKYIKDAVKAYDTYKAVDTYTEILTNNGSVAGVSEILAKPQEAALIFGEGANDIYKDIEDVNKLATKYGEYIDVYVAAGALDDASINATLADQKAALVADIQSIATLDKFMTSLTTPMNIAKMAELGVASATEAAPVDITSMLVNPHFDMQKVDGEWVKNQCEWERGYADGWSGLGINTYDATMQLSRNCCELWNSGTGEFYQELIGMPAGKYRISCLAVYRDVDLDETTVAAYEEAGNEENWSGHNAEIYAKTQSSEQFSYVKAQAALKGTADSFTEVVRAYEPDEETGGYYATEVTVLAPEGEGENTEKYPYVQTWTHVEANAEDRSPFDKIINGNYYPNSLYGIKQWFVNSPAKVTNTVEIEVKNGETLRIGLRKPTSATNDCLSFDDFKLEYISGATFKDVATGIEEVNNEQPAQKVLYNTAGQIVDDSYQGIVIDSEGNKFFKN